MKNKHLTDEVLDQLLIEYMPKANILLDQLEEERDKNVPSHVFSKNYKRNMKRIIKEYSRTPLQRKLFGLRKYVASILVLLILGNGVLIASAQDYREKFFELINDVYGRFTSIITKVEEPLNWRLNFICLSYIPEGFEIISDIQTDITRKINYMKDDKIIVFKQSIITSGEMRIDTEDIVVKEMEINNQTIDYYYNKNMYTAYWNDDEFNYIISAEVSFEEFVNIIEGIIKK